MLHRAIATLRDTRRPHLGLSKDRVETLALILATNAKPRAALDASRKRWAIECLFGDAKTRGLNLEDTRLTDPRKLDLLMGLVALAIAWAAPRGPRPPRHPMAKLQGPRIPRKILVTNRVRPDQKPPQIKPDGSHPAMAPNR